MPYGSRCIQRRSTEKKRRPDCTRAIPRNHPLENPTFAPDYGAKYLGSLVGTNEYVRTRLSNKMDALEIEARAIATVEHLQTRNLLLRWCYCQKINYLQRTIAPPRLFEDFLPRFTDSKRKILDRLLPTYSSLTATQWTQACLNIQDGGLGLFNHVDIGPAAFAASLTECLHSLSTAIPHIDSLILQQDPSPTQASNSRLP